MSELLKQAYASNTETPLATIEFSHSALTGGVLRYVQGYYSITATLEDSSSVTFSPLGFGFRRPEKNVNGRQDLDIQIDNNSLAVWQEMQAVVTANRTTSEKVVCKFREFVESDLSAPASAVYTFNIISSSIDRNTANFRASFSFIPDVAYPKLRYYTTTYPGLKYVG